MKKLFSALLFTSLAFTMGAQSIVGGSGVCKTDGDPNLIAALDTIDQRVDCSTVRDTANNITYEYDASLAVGSRWVNRTTSIINSLQFTGDSITFLSKTWIQPATNGKVLAIKPAGNDSLYIMGKVNGRLDTLSSVQIPAGGLGEKIVFFVGESKLYVGIHDYAAIYDIGNPYAPVLLSSTALSSQITSYDAPNQLFIGTDGAGSIFFYDLELSLLASHNFYANILQSPDWTKVRNSKVYISCRGEGGSGSNIVTIDYSDLQNIQTVDTLNFADERPPGGIEQKDKFLYTYSTDTLLVINTETSDGVPVVVNTVILPDSVNTNSLVPGNVGIWPANGLTLIGDRLYLSAPNRDQVWVYDVSNPELPVYESPIQFPAGSSVSSTTYFDGLLVFGSSKNPSLYQMFVGTESVEKVKSRIVESDVVSAGEVDADKVVVNELYSSSARIGGFNSDENENPLIFANSDGVIQSTNKVTLNPQPETTYIKVKPASTSTSAWLSLEAPQVYDEDLVFRFLRGSGNSNRAFIRFDDYYGTAFGFGLLRGQDTTNYTLAIASNNPNPTTEQSTWQINESGELKYGRYGQPASLISGTPSTFPAFDTNGNLIESTAGPLASILPLSPVTIDAAGNAWTIDTAGIIRFQDLDGSTVDYQFVLSPNTSIPLLINRYEAGDTMGIRMQAGETYLRNSTGEYSLTDITTTYTGSLFENDADTLDAGVTFNHITKLESAELEGFTATDSTLTYTATETKRFLLQYNANINFNAGSAGTWRVDIRPYVNAANIDRANSTGLVETAGSGDDWRMLSGSAVVTLNTNDVISLRNTATIGINYILDNLNLSITEL
ncbi:hypothetical protein [Phaeodactylibacter xiamenensis]|uniref:hypothetical protein n=1 Tax=Phaeodactylibacter xiamenensis TaxID=1524460 RepID=UPI0024A89547|nr:hypothetical protein [Phaeodactylibacter xiamenensis]